MAHRSNDPVTTLTETQKREVAAASIRVIRDNLADLVAQPSIGACPDGVQLSLSHALGLLQRAAREADPASESVTIEAAAQSLARHLFGSELRLGSVGIAKTDDEAFLVVYARAGWRGRRVDEWMGFPVAWRTPPAKLQAREEP